MVAIIFSYTHSLIVPRCCKRTVQLNFTLLYQIFPAPTEFYNVQLLIEFLSSANLRYPLHYCTCMCVYLCCSGCMSVDIYIVCVRLSVVLLHKVNQLVLTKQICG